MHTRLFCSASRRRVQSVALKLEAAVDGLVWDRSCRRTPGVLTRTTGIETPTPIAADERCEGVAETNDAMGNEIEFVMEAAGAARTVGEWG